MFKIKWKKLMFMFIKTTQRYEWHYYHIIQLVSLSLYSLLGFPLKETLYVIAFYLGCQIRAIVTWRGLE